MTRTLVFWFGIALLVSGALFTAQGTGTFPYPASSFMIGDQSWVWKGLLMIAFGFAAVAGSRKLRA